MAIRLGIYELFGRTIPGTLYLFIILYVVSLLGWIDINYQLLNSISIGLLVILAVVAYTLGLILDPLAIRWHRLFKPDNFSRIVLTEFKARYPDWEIKINDIDWPIILAYLRINNHEMADNIEIHNVTGIMLRNISLGLAILSIIQAAIFFINFSVGHLVLMSLLLPCIYLSGRQGAKFRKWFYLSLFESYMAYCVNPTKIILRSFEIRLNENKELSQEESEGINISSHQDG